MKRAVAVSRATRSAQIAFFLFGLFSAANCREERIKNVLNTQRLCNFLSSPVSFALVFFSSMFLRLFYFKVVFILLLSHCNVSVFFNAF